MGNLLWLMVLLVVAASPWIVSPVRRVLEYEGIGYVLEYQILGFFMPRRYMSRRKHRLEREVEELKRKLKASTKQLEDEQVRLSKEVEFIRAEYRNHLYDINGKRSWRYLWTLPPVLSRDELEKREKAQKDKERVKKGKVATYTLPPGVNDTGFSLDDVRQLAEMNGRVSKLWFYRDARNQAMLDKQNNQQNNRKGGGNQNNQQQQK